MQGTPEQEPTNNVNILDGTAGALIPARDPRLHYQHGLLYTGWQKHDTAKFVAFESEASIGSFEATCLVWLWVDSANPGIQRPRLALPRKSAHLELI
jgi:hypothetical protein